MSEMVKAVKETGRNIETDRIDQILAKGVTSKELELSTTFIKLYTLQRDVLVRNCTELRLIYQPLQMVDRVIKKLIRQQVNIYEM